MYVFTHYSAVNLIMYKLIIIIIFFNHYLKFYELEKEKNSIKYLHKY